MRKVTKIKVIYRKFPDGDVIAIFPEILDHYKNGVFFCESYQTIGQHGACDPAIINDTYPAKPEDYKDLHEELQSIYEDDAGYPHYKLVVYQRFSRSMYNKLENQAKDFYFCNPERI